MAMAPQSIFQAVDHLISEVGLHTVCDSVDVPERRETFASIPEAISKGPLSPVIGNISPDGRLWKHQVQALQLLCDGQNVVVSTGTASGKSLIFQLYALHRLLTDSDSKVLVFYPLRALANDQLSSWEKLASSAGLGSESVGRIYGGIPMPDRDWIMEHCRVVLMTPDVCQAWLMRTLGTPNVNRFIGSLALLVLDESHVYESVFGSNTAFLLRRLLGAKRSLARRRSGNQLQIVAATATIDNPAEHMRNLTGSLFKVVDESENGAPRSPRRILHIEGPELGSHGEEFMVGLLGQICGMPERHRFISFVDSRQGVERIARELGKDSVKTYRSGYEARDRAAIESALRNGTLHGVVCTSALELGIDIADMDIGVNLGTPSSRKSFRQRLGRIGRRSPGVFLVVAPANAFTKYGEGLREYYESSVEPSYLYLGNRFVQFAHARCLGDESDALGRNPKEVPSGVDCPEGFPEILRIAREGWPKEFEAMAQIGGDEPHYNYALRQLGESTVDIQQGGKGFESEVGDMAYHQAIREAYPGATYLHMGNAYKVNQWSHGFNKLIIRVAPVPRAAPTRPILRKSVTIDLSREGIIPGRVRQSESGLLAEAEILVNESVEGFSIGNTQYRYSEERAKNPNMRRKQRQFRTTGVVVKIVDDWFRDGAVRREVAEGLRDLLARDRSIAPQDIDSAHTNIALATDAGPQKGSGDIVVIYDSVYGGLRLTESLFDEFARYIERLSLGAQLSQGDGIVNGQTAELLRLWTEGLSDIGDFIDFRPTIEPPTDGDWLVVYKPGSFAGIFVGGNPVEREIIEPVYRDFFNTGTPTLYYSYRDERNANGANYTPADAVQSVGQDWEWVFWNPDTGEYRDMEASD